MEAKERKLELADIAGYLPYGLKVKLTDEFIARLRRPKYADRREFDPMDVKSIEISYRDVYLSVTHESKEFSEEGLIEYFLLILRPMTDLVKPMTHPDINGGEEFVPLIEMAKKGYGECFENGDSWNVCDKFKDTVRCTKIKSDEYFLFGFDYHLNGNIYFELLSNKCDGDNIPQQPSYYNIDFLTQIEFLSRLHFDYNNLIGQGLAIDINTIK